VFETRWKLNESTLVKPVALISFCQSYVLVAKCVKSNLAGQI
jgi:hypothetical protein